MGKHIISIAVTAKRIQRPLPAAAQRGKGRREWTWLWLPRDVGHTLGGRPLIAIGPYTGLSPQGVSPPRKAKGIRPTEVETALSFNGPSIATGRHGVEHLASRMRREVAAR